MADHTEIIKTSIMFIKHIAVCDLHRATYALSMKYLKNKLIR